LIVEEIQSDVFPKVTTTTTKKKGKQAGGIMNYKQGGAYGPLRGTSGSRGVAKAFRGKEGFKESQKLQRKLSLTDKLKMQNRGVIDKKTGRLHPEHERALKALSKKELKQLIKTGQNPRYKSDYQVLQPGSLASLGRKQWKKNKQTTKQEGKYFKEMKAKGIKKSGGVIQKQTGGHIPRRFRTSLEKPHKWTAEQFGGGVKGKPHSTQEGRIAAGERLFKRFWDKKKEEDKKRRMGPPWKGGAFARPKEAEMNMKKGGVVQKVFLGKLMEMFGRGKKATAYGGPANQGGPEPTRKQTMDVFKDKFAERHQKGGVMEKRKTYKLAHKLKNKDRLTTRDIERAEKLTKGVGKDENRQAYGQATKSVQALLDQLLKKGKKPSKPHGEKQDPVGKKKGGKVKRGCANGGTVVMPTVGNDVRTRAYKHGALIHPRPRPTTVLHGRERARGVGIAKRGW